VKLNEMCHEGLLAHWHACYCMLVLHVGTACWYCMLVLHIGTACWYCMLVLHVGTACWYCMLVLHVGMVFCRGFLTLLP